MARTTVGALKDKILRGALGMAAPDVEVVDGKGTILISSEEGETQENNDKLLKVSSSSRGTVILGKSLLVQLRLLLLKLWKLPVRKMLRAALHSK